MRISFTAVILGIVLCAPAIGEPQKGSIRGTFVPPDAPAQVTVLQDGKVVATAPAGKQQGAFRIPLASGTYTVVVTAPVSPLPVRFEGVVVKAGETTTLAPVLILPESGKAVLEGKVVPPRPDSEVVLYSEGRERAAVRADREGRYEFKELPAGSYEVRASAPGHAADVVPVVIPENQRVRQTAVLLPVAAADGVDWDAGKVRATGIGYPPKEPVSAGAVRAMTQRAALADAQRNLLRTVQQIRIDGTRSVGTIMRSKNGAERIRGYLKGYAVVSERVLEDGRMEVVLELPLTGPAGLSRYIPE